MLETMPNKYDCLRALFDKQVNSHWNDKPQTQTHYKIKGLTDLFSRRIVSSAEDISVRL